MSEITQTDLDGIGSTPIAGTYVNELDRFQDWGIEVQDLSLVYQVLVSSGSVSVPGSVISGDCAGRVMVVSAENRVMVVQAENRRMVVPCGGC